MDVLRNAFRTDFGRRTLELLAFSAMLTMLVIWWSWPLVPRIESGMFGIPGDSTGSIYDLWQASHYGFSLLPGSRNQLLGYPTGIASGGPLLLPGLLLYIPGVLLSLIFNEIVAYNILILVAVVGTGLASLVFFREIVASRAVAWGCSLAFTMLPYHQLSVLQWYGQGQLAGIPLSALCCLRFQEGPTSKRLGVLLGSVVLGFLTNAYVGLLTAVLALGAIALSVIDHRRQVVGAIRKLSLGQISRVLLAGLMAGGFIVVLVSAAKGSVQRSLDEVHVYGLRIAEMLRPTPFSTLRRLVQPVSNYHGSNLVEVSHYIGLSVAVIAAVSAAWFTLTRRTSRVIHLALATCALSLWFGVTTDISIAGFTVYSPARVISEFAPFWRVFSRFGILFGFGCLILVSQLLDTWVKSRSWRVFRGLGTAGLLVVVIADLMVVSPGRFQTFETPSYVAFLQTQPHGVMMEYPLARTNDFLRYDRRLTQRNLRNPSVNGGYETDERLAQLGADDLQKPDAKKVLQALGVKWIVVQDREYEVAGAVPPTLPQDYGSPVFNQDGVRIFELGARGESGVGWIEAGGYPLESMNGVSGQWVGAESEIVVARHGPGCARLSLRINGYSDHSTFGIRQVDGAAREVPDGLLQFHLDTFEDVTRVKLTSRLGAFQIPGPDPREVSAWIWFGMTVDTEPCAK